MDKIVKLTNDEALYDCTPHQQDNMHDYIVVIREKYSDELMAYYVRSKIGILLYVNEMLTAKSQARAISIIKNKIRECGTAEVGVLKRGYKYYCGGTCCDDSYSSVI
ncbi:MAG: hypothetical protein ACI4LK_09215 [Lentihominibacter sp.]